MANIFTQELFIESLSTLIYWLEQSLPSRLCCTALVRSNGFT